MGLHRVRHDWSDLAYMHALGQWLWSWWYARFGYCFVFFFFFFFSNAIESAILEKEVSTNYEEVLAAATRWERTQNRDKGKYLEVIELVWQDFPLTLGSDSSWEVKLEFLPRSSGYRVCGLLHITIYSRFMIFNILYLFLLAFVLHISIVSQTAFKSCISPLFS